MRKYGGKEIYTNEYNDDIVFARFVNYMKITLKNKRIDYEKHQKYLKYKEQKLSQEEWTVLSNKDSLVCSFCVFKEYGKLECAIDKLTEKQKMVIKKYYYKKETITEIGKDMNLTVNAVKQLKLRAISNLKKYMEDLSDE